MGKRQASKAPHDPVSLVLPPSLYLGPCSAASSKPFLTGNSITHVLSIGANPSAKVDGVTYYRLSLSDSVSSSISKITAAACEIIDGSIASKKGTGKILVHCSAGISRSPTVIATYLMKRKGMTLKAALGQIIRVRPQISPNAGFLQQLKEMEMELYGSSSLEVDELPKREKDRLALFEEPKEQSKAAAVVTETTC
jgi:atypical dual specificity phosphatase